MSTGTTTPAGERLNTERPFNLAGLDPDALARLRPRIADCTLRDGEQQPGVSFSARERVRLARAIDRLDVYELEVGTPAVSAEDRMAIEEIAGLGLNARLSALARAKDEDIRLVGSLGVHGVRLSLPISKRQRAAKIPLSDSDYLRVARRSCGLAKELGLEVIFSPYDTTRADRAFLQQVLETLAKDRLIDRVRVVDTAGVATPQAITELVGLVHEWGEGVPVEVHCHNDLGMATANSVAGVIAGAEYASTTINGIGERSGNAATEEVVMALEAGYGIATGLRLAELHAVSVLVQEVSGARLQAHKAVVGANAFSHETGPIAAAVLKDPKAAECFAPETVGNTRRIILGKQAGPASLKYRLSQIGIELPAEGLQRVLERVREQGAGLGRAIDDRELGAIVSELAGAGPGS